jgi:hypothetical protein
MGRRNKRDMVEIQPSANLARGSSVRDRSGGVRQIVIVEHNRIDVSGEHHFEHSKHD